MIVCSHICVCFEDIETFLLTVSVFEELSAVTAMVEVEDASATPDDASGTASGTELSEREELPLVFHISFGKAQMTFADKQEAGTSNLFLCLDNC